MSSKQQATNMVKLINEYQLGESKWRTTRRSKNEVQVITNDQKKSGTTHDGQSFLSLEGSIQRVIANVVPFKTLNLNLIQEKIIPSPFFKFNIWKGIQIH
jgi:hypothetical protein